MDYNLVIRSISPVLYWLFAAPNAVLGNVDPEKLLIVLIFVVIPLVLSVFVYCISQRLLPMQQILPDNFTWIGKPVLFRELKAPTMRVRIPSVPNALPNDQATDNGDMYMQLSGSDVLHTPFAQ